MAVCSRVLESRPAQNWEVSPGEDREREMNWVTFFEAAPFPEYAHLGLMKRKPACGSPGCVQIPPKERRNNENRLLKRM